MEIAQRKVVTSNQRISGVVLFGFVLLFGGIFIQDPFGVNLIVTGLGIALLIAGISYVATDGTGWVALTNAFITLVGAQLLAFDGILRLFGGLTILVVATSVVYTRL
jgi:hypothetical protein